MNLPMNVTLLATGSPIPLVQRGGTSLVISVGEEPVLVDCGPRTVLRMLEHGIPLAEVETLFFTHHHVDHNADFFQFAIGGWSMGRDSLTIYGPDGTEAFVQSLYQLYEEDIAYRTWFGHAPEGITDLEVVQTTGSLSVSVDSWSVTALPVEHSIETYAYRFEEVKTGQTCVISGDTRRIDALADFASGADLLIQDASIAPIVDDPPAVDTLPERLLQPMSEQSRRKHELNHCDAADAGAIAAEAGVGTLILTHLLPYRDHEAMREEATSEFDGTVVVAEDGMVVEP